MLVSDEPYALASEKERESRLGRLSDPHVAPLTEFVLSLRQAQGAQQHIPHFDPCDGGIRARMLFLLESPGPKAVATGFISRNNPDPTARNMCELLARAGVARADTILWNVVPWYIGNGTKLAGVTSADLANGAQYLRELLKQLPRLQGVVLVGRDAQAAKPLIPATLRIFETFHPSNRVRNRWPHKWQTIEQTFREVAQWLNSSN